MIPPSQMIDLLNLSKLASAATPEGEQGNRNWNSYPTGMDRETMRSFGFLGSHNHTPYILKHRAEFIQEASPQNILELIALLDRQFDMLERAEERIGDMFDGYLTDEIHFIPASKWLEDYAAMKEGR